jgi:SNF2 family DNA or RNA helicase
MIEKAQLIWNRVPEGFEFSVLVNKSHIAPQQWSKYEITNNNHSQCIDPIFRQVENELQPIFSDTKVFCSDGFIAELTEIEAKQLSLPLVSQATVKITAKGLISQPGFQLSYRLVTSDSRPILGAKREGVLLFVAGSQQILLNPIYAIVSKIDEFNSDNLTDRDERFVKWGEIKQLLPDNVVVDDQLQNITICRADRLTLDIKEHGTFNPLLIKPQSDKEWDIQNHAVSEYAVPKVKQKQFEDQFKSFNAVKSNYAIGNGTYVVLPKRLQKVLEIVKTYQTKPSEQRLAFVANPHKYINEKLEQEENPELLESLFVETPEFISQRIETIGVWEPKLCAYVVKRDGDWLPTDEMRLFFPIEDLMVNFSIDDMRQLLELVVKALDDETESLQFKTFEIPVTLETKNLLIRMLKPFDDQSGALPSDGLQVIAPILKDNIEDIEFEVIKKAPRPALSRLPDALKTRSLYEHQVFGIDWLAQHWESGSIGALLADDMGLGKTLQSMVLMAAVKQSMQENKYPNKPILIVAPSGLLKNWLDEAKEHLLPHGYGHVFEAYSDGIRHLKELSVVERNNVFSDADWVLTTYETLRDKIKYFVSVDWGLLIFDEAQKIKNPVSRVTEMAKSLSADFTLMLTGTPVENELKDLWCIVDTAQPGLFGSLSHFHREYASPAEADPTEAQRLKSLLVEKSSPPVMLRRLKEQHIPGLPAKIVHLVPVEMPDLQAQEYANIVKEAQNEAGLSGAILKFIQKIRRASLIAEDFDGNGITDGVVRRSARLSAMINILDEVQKKQEKALVFCEAIDVQEYLAGYLQQRYQLPTRPHKINGMVDGYTRKRYVDEFQQIPEGEFAVLLLSPKAGGVGLTITAANHVIHLTRWWNPAVEDQSTDRVFRIGQKKTVNVYIPMALHPKYKENSFDANLNRLLEKKRNLSLNALLPGTTSKEDMGQLFSDTVKDNN